MSRLRMRFVSPLLMAATAGLVACGGPSQQPLPSVTVTATAGGQQLASHQTVRVSELQFTITKTEGATASCALVTLPQEPGAVPQLAPENCPTDAPMTFVNGSYELRVRVTDKEGHGSDTALSWTVDVPAPDITLSTKPTNPSIGGTADFDFTATAASGTVKLRCALDQASLAPCTSPVHFTGLGDGAHTFKIEATGQANNVGQVSYPWSTYCSQPTVFVDAATGDDNAAGAGSAQQPFKSITKALASLGASSAGVTVQVRPGTYSAASTNETFPITVPAGACLLGDVANKGAGTSPTFISGCGTTAVVGNSRASMVNAGEGSIVAGFKVDAALQCIGLYSNSPGAILHSNSAISTSPLSSHIGILTSPNAENAIVSSNVVSGVYFGISLESAAKVQLNTAICNSAGIHNFRSSSDLGGGAAKSEGQNTLSCNNSYGDLVIEEVSTPVIARNNFWDHPAQLTSAVQTLNTGADIWKDVTGASADTAGAQQAPSCNCPGGLR